MTRPQFQQPQWIRLTLQPNLKGKWRTQFSGASKDMGWGVRGSRESDSAELRLSDGDNNITVATPQRN
jgi:hypothetical protein